MKRVLITGATGFIGRSLVSYLLRQGVRVTAIVRPTNKFCFADHVHLDIIFSTLDQIDDINLQLAGQNFDTIYHLAWAGVDTSLKNSSEIQLKNIDYALSVMGLAEKLNCQRVISTGSVSEYAYVEGTVNGRQMPCPSDLYAATKVSVHTYCELIARQNGFGFNWVLIPSIYGPGRDDNNLISYTIKMLLTGQRPTYTKLEQKWDYIYIDDLVSALYYIGADGKHLKTYAVGCGYARPLFEYVNVIRDKINQNAILGIGERPYKTSRIDNAIVDITELIMDTSFKPQVSFECGITKTIEYYKEKLGVI